LTPLRSAESNPVCHRGQGKWWVKTENIRIIKLLIRVRTPRQGACAKDENDGTLYAADYSFRLGAIWASCGGNDHYRQGAPKKIGDTGMAIIGSPDFPHQDRAKALFPNLCGEIIKLTNLMKDHLKSIEV
jgi:hypothetical protein